MRKILFLGGNRAVSLVKEFNNYSYSVYTYAPEQYAPITQVAEVVPGFGWDSLQVHNDIELACAQHKIDLVLPLDDKAVVVASSLHCNSVSCTPDTALLCLNKKLLERAIYKYDFYPKARHGWPAIMKPAFGHSSKDISYIQSYQEDISVDKNFIFQNIIKGTEYTVDTYFNKDFKFIDAVPRIRLRVANGEVLDSITKRTAESFQLIDIIKFLSKEIQFRGPVCFQFIMDKNRHPWLIEINARFGGGVILSMAAGCDFIKMITQEYIDNNTLSPASYESIWRTNVLMKRVNREFFFEKNSN